MGGCDGAVSKAAESRRPLAEATHTSAKAQDAVYSAVNGSPPSETEIPTRRRKFRPEDGNSDQPPSPEDRNSDQKTIYGKGHSCLGGPLGQDSGALSGAKLLPGGISGDPAWSLSF
jgi:hypothetical protein